MGLPSLIQKLRTAAEDLSAVRSGRPSDKELRGPFLRTRDALMAMPGGMEVFAEVAGRYLRWETDDLGMEADLIESSLSHCDQLSQAD